MRWQLGLAAASVALFTLGPAQAQEPAGSTFQVNTTPKRPASDAVVGMDAAGNFVVVWTSATRDGSGRGIAAQRFDSAGTPVGSEFQVNSYTTGDQMRPSVARAASGEFVVVWQGDSAAGAPTGIFAQRFDAAGEPIGSEFQVNALTTAAAEHPDVVVDPTGGFAVSWQGQPSAATGWDIYVRRFDAAGLAASPEFRANQTVTGDQVKPSVGIDATRRLTVAWERVTTAGRQGTFRQFNSTGTPVTSNDRVVDATSNHFGTDLAVAPSGSFVIVWGDGLGAGRAWDPTGVAVPQFWLTGTRAFAPSVVAHPDGEGEFLVAWKAADQDTATGADTRFRVEVASFDWRGRRVSPAYVISPDHATETGEPAVAMAGIDHMVATWGGAVPNADNAYARRMIAGRLTGTVTDALDGRTLSTALIGIGSAVAARADFDGKYVAFPPAGTYAMSAGAPGYVTTYATDVPVAPGATTVRDFALFKVPFLSAATHAVDDSGAGANHNGAVDPNERFLLTLDVRNSGGPATGVTATITGLTPGVTALVATAPYPDIPNNGTRGNLTPFELVTAPDFPVGEPILVTLTVSTHQGTFVLPQQYFVETGATASPIAFDAMGPVEIPDLARTGRNLEIPVSGFPTELRNVAISLVITHPSMRDLQMTLVTPDDEQILLMYANGLMPGANMGTDCPAGGNDTTFTTPGANALEVPAPYIGTLQSAMETTRVAHTPRRPPNAANGVWRFQAIDLHGPGQGGRIECARLLLYGVVPATGRYQEVAIAGLVSDVITGAPVPGATIKTSSGFSTTAGPDGRYRLDLTAGTIDVTASAPGHQPATVSGVVVTAGATHTVDLALIPHALRLLGTVVHDGGSGGNGNGTVDLDERFGLSIALTNDGETAATGVSATLSTATPGVVITTATRTYPDIQQGITAWNWAPFELSTTSDFRAGHDLVLQLDVTTDQGQVRLPVTVRTGTPSVLLGEFTAAGPVPIRDNPWEPSPAALEIAVPALPSTISKVLAQVHVTHPSTQNLTLLLQSPDGMYIRLVDRLLTTSAGANFGTDCPADGNDTTFDDAAPVWISAGAAPRAGAFRPEQPLATFQGRTPGGTWKLIAYNASGTGTVGRIECVRLVIYGYASGGASDTIFADGFEAGDLSAWTGGSIDGGDLRASTAAALNGTYGLEAVVNDTQALYVRDNTPADEPRYRARFAFDPNGFDPGEAAGAFRSVLFIGLEEAPVRRLVQIVLKRQAGEYSLLARVTLDDGSFADTPFVPITDGPHVVELDWRKATAPGANDGWFQLWVDGAAAGALGGLDNDAHALDFVRLGAMAVKAGAAGTMYFDRFASRRQTYIGP